MRKSSKRKQSWVKAEAFRGGAKLGGANNSVQCSSTSISLGLLLKDCLVVPPHRITVFRWSDVDAGASKHASVCCVVLDVEDIDVGWLVLED